MTLGVVAALPGEARALRAAASPQVLIQVSGVGAADATRAAEALASSGAGALLSWGVAGALDPAVAPGSVCLPHWVLEPGPGAAPLTRFATHDRWRSALAAALRSASAPLPGAGAALIDEECALLSGVPAALATAAAKRAAHAATGAVAIDMESAAVARVAAAASLPFLVVRVIADGALEEIPSSVVDASRSGAVRVGLLVRGLLASPAQLLPLLRLARRYRLGLERLRAVARSPALAPAGGGRAP